jgi:integrase
MQGMDLSTLDKDIIKNRSASYGPEKVGARLNLAEFKTKSGVQFAYVAILPKKFAGKRKRKQFATLTEATKWIDDEIKNKETTSATISEASDFNYCLPRLREHNVTISELLNFYEKRFIADDARLRLSALQKRLLVVLDARDKKLSEHTRRKIVTLGNRIEEDFKDSYADEVSAEQAYKWAIKAVASEGVLWSGKTRKHHWAHLNRLLNFAISERSLKSNPLDELSPEKLKGIVEVQSAIPEILTLKEAKSILKETQKHCPAMLPCAIVSLFDGLRQHEAWQLEGADFDFEEGTVHVSERIAKTRNIRFVELSDASKAWLKKCVIPEGNLLSFGTKSAEGRWTTILKKAKVHKHNALRHTAASVMLALKGEVFTKGQLGHAENSAILFKHYRHAMKKKSAQAMVDLRPLKTQADDNTVDFPKQAAV